MSNQPAILGDHLGALRPAVRQFARHSETSPYKGEGVLMSAGKMIRRRDPALL